MDKLHDIVDEYNKVVGYTVKGTFDSLIVYLHGNGYDHHMHGETSNFAYYCTMYGWKYTLREVAQTQAMETKDLMDMSYPERICSACYQLFSMVEEYWKTTQRPPTCVDVQKFAYQTMQTHIISHTIEKITVTGYIGRLPTVSLTAKVQIEFTQKLVDSDQSDLANLLGNIVSDFYYYKSSKIMEFQKTFEFE